MVNLYACGEILERAEREVPGPGRINRGSVAGLYACAGEMVMVCGVWPGRHADKLSGGWWIYMPAGGFLERVERGSPGPGRINKLTVTGLYAGAWNLVAVCRVWQGRHADNLGGGWWIYMPAGGFLERVERGSPGPGRINGGSVAGLYACVGEMVTVCGVWPGRHADKLGGGWWIYMPAKGFLERAEREVPGPGRINRGSVAGLYACAGEMVTVCGVWPGRHADKLGGGWWIYMPAKGF